jgi:hypothetical protein
MQEKKNKGLFILLVLLLASITVLLYTSQQGEKKFEQKDIFKIEDLKAIDKVELRSAHDTVQLSFSGNRWVVNGAEPADRDMVDVLFATLLQAEAKRPVAESKNDSLVQMIKQSGVDVNLFEQGKLIRSFVAGGNGKKSEAYFVNEAERAYVMHIPGYRVYVSGVFEMTESDWRDKYVFSFNWTNFKNLEVKFSNKPNDGFDVKMLDGYFGIDGMPADTTRLNDFLDAVSLLTVDQYTKGDSLTNKTPLLTITVSDIAERKYKLAVFEIVETGKSACLVNGKQAAWIDNRKLSRLMKNRDFFQKRP